MSLDLDSYLSSDAALKQTIQAEGQALRRGQLLDEFRVVAFLGRGASSEVWRIVDLRTNQEFAIKYFVATGEVSDSARLRFILEARLLNEFRHKNIVRVYKICETGAHPYFTKKMGLALAVFGEF